MSCSQGGVIECDTVQIIEPKGDFLIDTAGSNSDLDERGELPLSAGQTHAEILFKVSKLNANYHFEYLYVDAGGIFNPGAVVAIPTIQATYGFQVVFAAAPPISGYVLRWRVTIVQTSSLVQIDAPENLYLLMPNANLMSVLFSNPRSNTNYGFSELRVENLTEPPAGQAIIRVQVVSKTVSGFIMAVNPTPPVGSHYFLKVRTP